MSEIYLNQSLNFLGFTVSEFSKMFMHGWLQHYKVSGYAPGMHNGDNVLDYVRYFVINHCLNTPLKMK